MTIPLLVPLLLLVMVAGCEGGDLRHSSFLESQFPAPHHSPKSQQSNAAQQPLSQKPASTEGPTGMSPTPVSLQ